MQKDQTKNQSMINRVRINEKMTEDLRKQVLDQDPDGINFKDILKQVKQKAELYLDRLKQKERSKSPKFDMNITTPSS